MDDYILAASSIRISINELETLLVKMADTGSLYDQYVMSNFQIIKKAASCYADIMEHLGEQHLKERERGGA